MTKVVIVGNSPELQGSFMGGDIDRHDVVIRLTSFRTTGYEADVGERSDVIFLTPYTIVNSDTFSARNKNRSKYMMAHPTPISRAEWSKFAAFPSDARLNLLSHAEIEPLRSKIGLDEEDADIWPCTGTIAIDWAIRNYPDADIRVIGFSALTEEGLSNFRHYDGTVSPLGAHHDLSLENAYLRSLVQKGIVKHMGDAVEARHPRPISNGKLSPDKSVCILSHHVKGQRGGVMHTINRLLSSQYVEPYGRLKLDYIDPHEIGNLNIGKYDTVLVNGGNALRNKDILSTLFAAHRIGKEVIVYWHDNYTVFQAVMRFLREVPSLLTILQSDRFWFWSTSSQIKVALQCCFAIRRDKIHLAYNICEPIAAKGSGNIRSEGSAKTLRRIVAISHKASRDKGLFWFQKLAAALKDDDSVACTMLSTNTQEEVDQVLGEPAFFKVERWAGSFNEVIDRYDLITVLGEHESFSLVAAESILSGKQVLVTDTAGICEHLPDDNIAKSSEEVLPRVRALLNTPVSNDLIAHFSDTFSIEGFLNRTTCVNEISSLRRPSSAQVARKNEFSSLSQDANDDRGGLVSIIMPAFNMGSFITDAIRSVISQTYLDLELIVVDDGSEDNTKEIIKSFSDPRIRLIENATNRGLVYSLNKGVKSAKGGFIARFDADDICRPERFERQVKHLKNNPHVDFVGTAMGGIDESGFKISRSFSVAARHPYANRYMMLKRCPFYHPTVMFRRGIMKNIKNLYDDRNRFEDWSAWSRISDRFTMENIPEQLVEYRVRTDGLSRNMENSVRMRETRVLLRKYYDKCGIQSKSDSFLNYFTFPSMNKKVSFPTMEMEIRDIESDFIRYIRKWHRNNAPDNLPMPEEQYLKAGLAEIEAITNAWIKEFERK